MQAPEMIRVKLDVAKAERSTTYTHKKYEVRFPFDPYPIQKTFMNSLLDALDDREHALLQSPTGTGKTICLLVAALTWLRQQTVVVQGKRPKLIYLSRTHHQLKQVVRQIKKTCFLPRVITASSRDHACINTEINHNKGHQLEIECRKRIRIGDENKKVQVTPCQYFFNVNHEVRHLKHSEPVVRDLQEIKVHGSQAHYCPFFLARQKQLRDNADIILMPYNYLTDHNTFGIYKDDIENAIIIFDEAHNVLGAASDGYSFQVTLDMIGLAINELRNVQTEYYQRSSQERESSRLTPDNIEFLGKRLRIFSANLYAGKEERMNTSDEFSFGVMMQYAKMAEFLMYCLLMQGEEQNKVLDVIQQIVNLCGIIMEEFSTTFNWSLDKIYGFLINVQKMLKQWLDKDLNDRNKMAWSEYSLNNYRLHLKLDNFTTVLQLWCLDPSLAFMEILKNKPHNIVLTSGTLSPLYSWEAELKTAFKKKLINKHVIAPRQLLVACVSKINTSRMVFSYENRSNKLMISDFGDFLLKISETVPHGVLVIFSSYSMLFDTRTQLVDAKIWDKINFNKEILSEPKEQSKLAELLALYGKKANSKRGAFLFGVFRGKVAEGIDLSDNLCRAVIVVGVPYPPVKDLKVQEKRKYLDMRNQKQGGPGPQQQKVRSIDGRTWYTLQTIRAVNQAIGRVIRHIKDYGAIYFVDSRYYANQQLSGLISEWAKPALKNYEDVGELMKTTQEFFSRNELEFKDSFLTDEFPLTLNQVPEPEPLPRMKTNRPGPNRQSFKDAVGSAAKQNGRLPRNSLARKLQKPNATLDNYFTAKRYK